MERLRGKQCVFLELCLDTTNTTILIIQLTFWEPCFIVRRGKVRGGARGGGRSGADDPNAGRSASSNSGYGSGTPRGHSRYQGGPLGAGSASQSGSMAVPDAANVAGQVPVPRPPPPEFEMKDNDFPGLPSGKKMNDVINDSTGSNEHGAIPIPGNVLAKTGVP